MVARMEVEVEDEGKGERTEEGMAQRTEELDRLILRRPWVGS